MTWMLRNNMLMESMQQIQLSDQATSNLPRRIGFHELSRSRWWQIPWHRGLFAALGLVRVGGGLGRWHW